MRDKGTMPRTITEREVYDHFYFEPHKTCMDMAIQEAKDMSAKHKIPIELFDISALTFQHWKKWSDNWKFIKDQKKKWQEREDGAIYP